MKKAKIYTAVAAISALLFVAVAILVKTVDVSAIGPLGSSIGLSSLNGKIRDAIGYSEDLYTFAELLGYVSLSVVGGFAVYGAIQLVKLKNFKKLDKSLWLLGGFYIAVIAVYALFEIIVINERPVLMDGELEASFPSTHTMLAICIMATAAHQLVVRLANKVARIASVAVCSLIATATVVCRLLSGVHWFTDIIAGIFIGGTLVFTYLAVYEKFIKGSAQKN